MKKSCPKCNGTMDFRLGMYECPQCGHTEEKQQQPQEAERSFSGPGLKKPQQWQQSSHDQSGYGSSSGMPGQAPPPGQLPSPGLYNPAEDRTPRTSSSSLETEKGIYMGLQIISIIIIIIDNASSDVGSITVGNIIGSIIGLGIVSWVLYGDAIWAKWGCICTSALGIFIGFALFFALADGSGWFAGIIQIAVSAWLISILHRDIQQLKGA